MKLLWICSTPLREISLDINQKPKNICGWLSGFAEVLKTISNIEFHFAFPTVNKNNLVKGYVDGIYYYSFYVPKVFPFINVGSTLKVTKYMKKTINDIITSVNPDILHVFGTESIYSKIAIQSFDNQNKVIVSIQGLVHAIAKHYTLGLPHDAQIRCSVSSLIRGNIVQEQKKFERRGVVEKETLSLVKNVIGRTDWDKACVRFINPEIKYYFCNENLRHGFYKKIGAWDIKKCVSHAIFMSQGNYPVKGLHLAVKAMRIVCDFYPDTVLYIGGNDPTKFKGLYNKIKISPYGLYLRKLIKKLNLCDNIKFLGMMTEEEMIEQYLKANVVISPSVIENSPNSIGEAMIMGVPVVASNVGGVSNLLQHAEDGYLYPADEYYMLSHYIMTLFDNEDIIKKISRKAVMKAKEIHNVSKNIDRLLEIYREVYGEEF